MGVLVLKVVYVRASKSRGYTVLGIDSGEGARAYTVPDSVYAQIGSPLGGFQLDGGDFSAVVLADESFRATKKALSLLAYADNNLYNLKMKLRRAGFSREAIDQAAAEMQRDGYVDERRQLERIILSEVRVKLAGPRLIVPKLLAKGYKRDDVESVLDALIYDGQIDFEQVKSLLIEKKLGDSPAADEVKKLLYKHGFNAYD